MSSPQKRYSREFTLKVVRRVQETGVDMPIQFLVDLVVLDVFNFRNNEIIAFVYGY